MEQPDAEGDICYVDSSVPDGSLHCVVMILYTCIYIYIYIIASLHGN